ncbi:hypothetical protein [Bradyrhizobium sp. STM 3561]|uniref:hypothetical protein n=1 Tax=Bradyrhizobium sp. STM 3561 TaxID=578923 RepID=UPI0038905D21
MAYALFKDEEKLSRTFPTKKEALEKAEQAGLVEHPGGQPALPCSADPIPHDYADLDWTPDKPAS